MKSQNTYENLTTFTIKNGVEDYENHVNGLYRDGFKITKYRNNYEEVLPKKYIETIQSIKYEKIDEKVFINLYNHYSQILKKFENEITFDIYIKVTRLIKVIEAEEMTSLKCCKWLYALNFRVKSKKNNDFYERGFGESNNIKSIFGLDEQLCQLIYLVKIKKRDYKHIDGYYPVVLDPEATGLFIHEVIGHNLEADIWLNNTDIQREFTLGKRINNKNIDVIDNPTLRNGYGSYLFDDEGTLPQKTKIIMNGKVNALMTSKNTAKILKQKSTGNARSISINYPPLVRMSNTYLSSGNDEIKDIFKNIEFGFYFKGTGDSTGGLSYRLCFREVYLIENGAITDLVLPLEMSGNSRETFSEIELVANDFQIYGGGDGGCGKSNQWPLAVSSGGPHIKLKKAFIKSIVKEENL